MDSSHTISLSSEAILSQTVTDVSQTRITSYQQISSTILGILTAGLWALWTSQVSFSGFLNLLAVIVALLFIPTAKFTSSRVAINGSLFIGFAPMLWWGTSTFHLSLFLSPQLCLPALLIGATVFSVSWNVFKKTRILPQFRYTDLIIIGAIGFLVFIYSPFLSIGKGFNSSFALIQGLAGDIVGHYNMVVMTMATGVSGFGWGIAPDGQEFAYENYPQHFHTIAAFFGQGFAGTTNFIPEQGPSSFLTGTAVSLILGLTVLIAAAISALSLSQKAWMSGLISCAILGSLANGFGAENIQAGFPNFVFAVIALAIMFFFSIQNQNVNLVNLAVQSGVFILIANSWFLLIPLAAVFLSLSYYRFLKHSKMSNLRKIWSFVVSITTVSAGTLWSLMLILHASKNVGGPLNVLSIAGGTPTIPLGLVGSMVLFASTLSIFSVSFSRIRQNYSRWLAIATLGFAIVGFMILLFLVLDQIIRNGSSFYYQKKFANAMFLVFSVILVVQLVTLIVETIKPREIIKIKMLRIFAGLITAVALFSSYSSIPTFSNGFDVRADLYNSSATHNEPTMRMIDAARILNNWPCENTIYLAADQSDPAPNIANQWAHALSLTWTQSSSDVNDYLANNDPAISGLTASELATGLLETGNSRCVVVSPAVFSEFTQETIQKYQNQILTW